MRKYHNVAVEVDGYDFDSGAEARRYGELRLLERNGDIRELEVHPRWALVVNGRKIATYEADFAYSTLDGRRVVEDVKPPRQYDRSGKLTYSGRTAVYQIKKRLMRALYGIEIVEVEA